MGSDKCRCPFRSSPPGPPSSLSLPNSSIERGCILASEGGQAILMEPTSLKRGEGLTAESKGADGGAEGEGEGGGGEVVVEEGARMNKHQP